MPWYEVTIGFEAADENAAMDQLDKMIGTYCGCTDDMPPYDENDESTWCQNPNWFATGPVVVPDEEEEEGGS